MNQPQRPALRPKYLLDTERWKVRLYDDCWQDADRVLQRQGYGAISYSWGKWRDRRDDQIVLDDPKYPTFDIGFRTDEGHIDERLRWSFNIVRPLNPQTGRPGETGEQFTIRDIQAVFNSMGRRFVWWDWACIPQNMKPDSPQVLRDDETNEMNKMRYVYPHATRGTIWVHDVANWDMGQSAVGNAIQVCTRFFGMRGNPRTLSDITNVVQALKAAEVNEAWFRSLWCFQEGVLFSHNSNSGGGTFRDRRGSSIAAETAISGEGDLLTLVTVSSGIVATIINAMRVRAETANGNNNNQIQPPNNANAPNMNFTTWCSLAGSESGARWILNRLVSTGLVFLATQNPLSILNARFNRERGRTSAEDLEVNTIIGALEVDIAQYQALAMAQHPTGNDFDRNARLVIKREGMLTELFKIYQWRMLMFAAPLRGVNQLPRAAIWSSLVRIGEAMHPSYAALEYFLSTQYLSDRFCPPPLPMEGQVPELPRVNLNVPPGQVALPELEYVTGALVNVNDNSNSGVLVLRNMQRYRLFRLANMQPQFWTKCMFYAYHDADPPQPPPGVQAGNNQPNANNEPRAGVYMCQFRHVEQARWQEAFGPDAALVPVEYLGVNTAVPWSAQRRLRCVVLNRFTQNATAAGYPELQMPGLNPGQTYWAGVFVGVVDLERAGAYIELDQGDLALTNDVVMF